LHEFDTLIPIAEGASGRVYRARDRATGRVMAIKQLRHSDATQILRLKREAAAQQHLDHPNICRVHCIERDDQGRWQLVMDYIPGNTLAQRMDHLALSERIEVLARVARGVEFAHSRGILHRDLKPANIVLRESPTDELHPVVLDFGLARGNDEPAMTTTGEVLGTPAYMAPEQALGDSAGIGPASDVFALGCILFEALTGSPPFSAATISACLDRLLHTDPPHPRKLNPHAPEPLCRVALQCLERQQKRRYASARHFAEDLERWLRDRPVLARRYSPIHRWTRHMARQPLLTALGVTGLLLIAALVGWSVWQARLASERESLAAELGSTLTDVRNRITIARLAPIHDIGGERQNLADELSAIAERHRGNRRFADLIDTNLARAYLAIGELERAELHVQQARRLGKDDSVMSVWAEVLLARYIATLVPIMELPVEQRERRLDQARQRYLQPAQAVLDDLAGTGREAAESLVRLTILERRFQTASRLIEAMGPARPHDYLAAMLVGELTLERAEQALENGDRAAAQSLFADGREHFHAIAEIARSDPQPRQLACRAARGELRSRLHLGTHLPADIADLDVLCTQLLQIDAGSSESWLAQAAAYATIAAAWDAANRRETARELLERGVAATAQGLAIDANNRGLLEFRARMLVRLAGLQIEDFNTAKVAFEKAAEAAERLRNEQPDNPVGALLLGKIMRDYARQRSLHGLDAEAAYNAAEASFSQAMELDGQSPEILSEAALNAQFQFYKLRPDDPTAAIARARQAIDLQNRALELDADNVDFLFDQGANYGDLWFYLQGHPDQASAAQREALRARALALLARVRLLAPSNPSGYGQAMMIVLSDAETRLDLGQSADEPIAKALGLQQEATEAGVLLDRGLPAWTAITRVRAGLSANRPMANLVAEAWQVLDGYPVDSSDQFYHQLQLLELTGLTARWRRQEGMPIDEDRLRRGHAALDDLLARGRRQAGVLCHGGRIVLESGLLGGHAGPTPLARARALIDECLESDSDFLAAFSEDLKLLEEFQSNPPASALP